MCWMYYVLPAALVTAGIVCGLWNFYYIKSIQNKTLVIESVGNNENGEINALSPRIPALQVMTKNGPMETTNSVAADDFNDMCTNEHGDISVDFVSFESGDKEIVNTKNVTVYSGYGSTEDDAPKDAIDKLDKTRDDVSGSNYSQSNSDSSWSGKTDDDSSKLKSNVESTEDEGNESQMKKKMLSLLSHRKKAKSSVYSTMMDGVGNEQPTFNKTNMHCSIDSDQITRDTCSTNRTRFENGITSSNYLDSPDFSYKGSSCTMSKSKETYDSNSASSLKLVNEYSDSESLPSTIYCDDNSSGDIQYVEDFSDMSQSTSSNSTASFDDKMNEAFIEL